MTEPFQYQFFFIRGFMKSGTNWLGRLLQTHPDVRVVGEFHWEPLVTVLNRMLRRNKIFSRLKIQESVRAHFDQMIRDSLIAATDNRVRVIGERTPTTLEPITLRGAPHLAIIRDGRDVLVSRAFHLFNHPNVTTLFDRFPEMQRDLDSFQADPWYFRHHPDRLLQNEEFVRDSCRWWKTHLQRDRETVEKLPRLPVRFVRYEDLQQDIEGERMRLLEFLGLGTEHLPPIPDSLRPDRIEENPTAFVRKGIVGDWKNYFTETTRAWFKQEAGEELIRQGYADSNQW